MTNEALFKAAENKGFHFAGARGWITEDSKAQLAQDAALVTAGNNGVPVELSAYIDPQVIEILTAVRNARRIFKEVKKGDWTVSHERFRVEEYTGITTPYSDYADGAVSDVNENWPVREQYRFQTTIKYGDLEQEVSALARMNLASSKQRAAARAIDIDANRFYLYGVAGKACYGLLNEPNLNTALTPATGSGGGTVWSGKTTTEIYEDVVAMFNELKTKSGGNIADDDAVILAVPTTCASYLNKASNFNISVKTMLTSAYPNLEIVELPELYDATTSVNTAFLIAKSVLEQPVGELAFGEKYRTFPVVRELSAYKQKVMATTYGCVLYMPFGVVRSAGI